MLASFTGDLYTNAFTLNLLPGQSATIVHFALLARADTNAMDYGPGGSNELDAQIALAIANGQNMTNTPNLDGLSSFQLNSIVNFDVQSDPGPNMPSVPEPTAVVVWLVAATVGVLRLARVKKARITRL